MKLDLSTIREYYESLSDKELESQFRLGPSGFATAEIWRIVQQAHEDRSGVSVTVPALVTAGEEVDRQAIGPWFLFERLAGGKWPEHKVLPTTYLTVIAVVSGLWTILHLLNFVSSLIRTDSSVGLGSPDEPALELASGIWSALFAGAASTRRPWGWYYLTCATLLAAFFLNTWAAVLWYPLFWLYLARRRTLFGLSSWPSLM